MNIKKIYFILTVIILSISILGCKNKKSEERLVSVSILPQKYFIERIAGDYLQVNVMIPPGMSPATCDLSTGQLKKLYDSELCFTIGYLPFEITHLYPALQNKQDIQVINHSKNIELISGSCGHSHEGDHEHEGGVDPHIWMSPRYAKQMATDILQTLSEKYPEQQASFEANYKKLTEDIDSVAARAEQVLSDKQNKSFLIYHPALTYFAKDYGMEQISIENEGKEPNPAHIKEIIDMMNAKNIHIIFIQNQFDVTNAESIAKQTGESITPINPLNENWLEEMNSLITIFDEKLQ